MFMILDTNYRDILLFYLHFTTTSSHWKTPCITSFSFIYYFQFIWANYQHLLLPWLLFAITSSCHNTPCNRFFNNYVIIICPNQLLWFISISLILVIKLSQDDWNASFEKCCNFYPNNYKFCSVKKNYEYLEWFSTETCYS